MGYDDLFGELCEVPMKIKDLILFLSLEMASVVWAALAFVIIPSKTIAGASAGGFFLLLALFMLYRILRWPNWWSAWTFYPLVLFLAGSVIPMLWVRFSNIGVPFNSLRILGMAAPEFHRVSSSTLGLLILVTLAETIAEIVKLKKT